MASVPESRPRTSRCIGSPRFSAASSMSLFVKVGGIAAQKIHAKYNQWARYGRADSISYGVLVTYIDSVIVNSNQAVRRGLIIRVKSSV